MPLLAFSFWANFSVADDQKILSQKDCNEIKGGALYLLTVADEKWKALEKSPDGSPDFTVHTATIKWAVDVATKYTTIYKVFCDTKKRR